MALAANALIELDPGKIWLGIPLAEASMDDLVMDIINHCSTLIESYCNRKFIEQTFTERHNGSGTTELLVNQWPINSITTLHIDSSREFGVETLIDSASYEFFNNEQEDGYSIEIYEGNFPEGRKNVKIVYAAGYPVFANVPSDLQMGCKIALAFYYQHQQQQDWTMSTKSKGEENIVLVQGLPESATKLLANYKRLEMLAPPNPVRNN